MLLLIFTWVLIFAVCYSFGQIVVSLYNYTAKSNISLFTIENFFLGLAFVSAAVNLTSIFVPTNTLVLAVFLLVSVVYYICKRRNVATVIKEEVRNFSSFSGGLTAFTVAVFFLILLFAVSGRTHDDYWVYHQPVIKWLKEYGIVPGLGNLHSRYAFNPSLFNLTALFTYETKLYPTIFSINSLCYLVYSFFLINRIRRTKNILEIIVYIFLILFPLAINNVGKDMGTTSTDILTGLITIYLIVNIVTQRLCFFKKYLLVFILPVFCVTLKLSSGFIGLLCLVVLYIMIREKRWRYIMCMMAFAVLVITPWLIQNVILSGYLIYPLYELDLFSFDWKMPQSMIIDERNVIKSWTLVRYAHQDAVLNMSLGEWFPIWFKDQQLVVLFLYFLILLLFPVGTYRIFKNRRNKQNRSLILAWVVCTIGVIFFAFNPAIRFGFGIILAFLPVLVLSLNKIENFKYLNLFYTCTICGALLYFVPPAIGRIQKVKTDEYSSNYSYSELLLSQQPIIKLEIYQEVINSQGRKVYIGIGDKLPAALFYNEGLEFRGETLKDGFRMQKGYNPRGGMLINKD